MVSTTATIVLFAKATPIFAVRLVVSGAAKLASVTSRGSMWTGKRMISGSGFTAVVRIQASGSSQKAARISRLPVNAIVP